MSCAVLNCKNNENSQDKNNKISFHRFPARNVYKAIWVEATGRGINWKPTNKDCLCSEHFQPTLFQIRNKKPFLKGSAVPTLKCIIPSSISLANSTPPKTVTKNVPVPEEQYDETDDEEVYVYIECDQSMDITPNSTYKPSNSPWTGGGDTLDDQLAEIEFKINHQNRQIKHLLQRQRRHNSRLPKLRDQIVNLNKSNETVCTNLENLGFPIASEILSRIILCDRNEVNDLENPYSEAFEKFIVTLYSLSPAAYNMMRTTFPLGVFPDENFVKNNCSILEIEFADDT